jgi:uncharacterized protein YtpQ (UPF0354 family)
VPVRLTDVQAPRATFFPVVVGPDDPQVVDAHLVEDFVADLGVAYTMVPRPGERLLMWDDLGRLGVDQRELRRQSAANLYAALGRVAFHGQPPALMLSFDGLESSVLLAHRFWDDLEQAVPGELVVGVPARDVVILTGSKSRTGMEKVRRAVDRVFFAGGAELLSRALLVRRNGHWEVWGAPGVRQAPVSAPLPALVSVPVPAGPPARPLPGTVPRRRMPPARAGVR